MRAMVFASASAMIILILLTTPGCQMDQDSQDHGSMGMGSSSGKTLYERLGGMPAIQAVVDDFVDRGATDPRVNFTRRGTPYQWQATPENVLVVKKRIAAFVAMAAGGPQQYEGKDMRSSHKGMMISNAEFDALAEDLRASLSKFNVPAREQAELMAVIEKTRRDIVGQ